MEKYQLDDYDRKLLQHLIDFPEAKWRDRAAVVGLAERTLRKRLSKPAFKKALNEVHLKLEEMIGIGQKAAAKRLIRIVQMGSEKSAIEAAKLLLGPYLNKGEITVNAGEIIYRGKFGEDGELITEKEELRDPTGGSPKNTIELLNGDVKTVEVVDESDIEI